MLDEIIEFKELVYEHFQENLVDISMEYIDKTINENVLDRAYEKAYIYVDSENVPIDFVEFNVKYFIVGYLAEHVYIEYYIENEPK